MFRGPLLHLGARLFARQLALEHLGANGLALGAELLDEGLLLRRRVGAKLGAIAGSETGTSAGTETSAVASREASTSTGAKTGALACGNARAGTGSHPGASAGTEAPARAGGEAASGAESLLPSQAAAEAARLSEALRHAHAAGTLTGEATHLLLVLDALRLTTGEVVDARERPGLQATLRESGYCDRGQCHGETKELDGAHLRLPMSVGDWTAPLHSGRSDTGGVKRYIGVALGFTAYHGSHGNGRMSTDPAFHVNSHSTPFSRSATAKRMIRAIRQFPCHPWYAVALSGVIHTY